MTGSTEPERPAPTLVLAAAGEDGHGHAADAAGGGHDAGRPDGVARVLGGAALLISLGAAALGGIAWRRSARRTAAGPGTTGRTGTSGAGATGSTDS
jgi:hypothetical protein